ncbi:MAG TPA: hypothetical protein VFZ97_12630 [Acidimicrobiales bacterium]
MANERAGSLSDEDLRAILHDGETIVAQGHVSIPPPPPPPRRAPRFSPGFLIGGWLNDRLDAAVEAERVADETALTSFPLDRYMVLVLTSERILTWSTHCHPGDPNTVLADVPLWQIHSITTEDLPLGPRKDVQITMQDGLIVVLRVDSVLANILVTRIRRRPG